MLSSLLAVVAAERGTAEPPTPEAPFAAIQYGTNGCIEVGVRPDAPFNQPRPRVAPASLDLLSAYPAFGYNPDGFDLTNGTNACRYNFRNAAGETIGSGYCVQWARGQRTGTGYDPLPWDGTIANDGYVRRILADNWPAQPRPAVSSTNATVINRQRSGAVAMAVHYFTDRIVMPPNYQDPALYAAVADVVNRALAAGPLPEPTDPRPTITGPVSGVTGAVVGPYTIGANAADDITVTISGGEAFTDAAGTQPLPSGSTVPPGTQMWVRSATPGQVELGASARVADPIGTLMVGDPNFRVQSMALANPLTLLGKTHLIVPIETPPLTPSATSQVSAHLVDLGRSVVDTFTVTGLGTSGTATLDVTLYGPLEAPIGDCASANWAAPGVPVARTFPPIPLVGDQVVDTAPAAPPDTGCYSFGAVLSPTPGVTFTMPPGDPTETFRVAPLAVILPWLVTSRASRPRIDPGDRVRDRISVGGMQTERQLTIRPVLLGPVSPVNGRCTSVNWAEVRPPLAVRFDAVQQTGNGTITTEYTRPTKPGCYSFAARVTNGFQTGGLVVAPHGYGHPRELVHVRAARPVLRTRATHPRVTPGRSFADRVHVTGLAPGTSATARARLYGPFAARTQMTCRPRNLATSVTWRIKNGWSRSPAVRVSAPGYYTWQASTAATATSRPSRHRCGQAAETVLAAKRPYPAPAINGGFAGVLPGYPGAPSARQLRLVIRAPGFGLRASVAPAGIINGAMSLPENVATTAWLSKSAGWRDTIGATVIAGHVSDRRDRPGALWDLSRAKAGQVISLAVGAHRPPVQRFKVIAKTTFDRTSRLPHRYFRTSGPHTLVLISCTRRVVYASGHFHYTRYQVVVARAIGRG